MNRFEFKQIPRKGIKGINIKEIMITKKNKTMMKYADIKKVYDGYVSRGFDPKKLVLKGANIDNKFKTLKSQYEENLKNWDEDEYYKDKVMSKEKFDSFYSYTIYIL